MVIATADTSVSLSERQVDLVPIGICVIDDARTY